MSPQRETVHLHYSNYALCGGFCITRNRYQSFNLTSKDSRLLVAKTVAEAQLFNPASRLGKHCSRMPSSGKRLFPHPFNCRKQDQNPGRREEAAAATCWAHPGPWGVRTCPALPHRCVDRPALPSAASSPAEGPRGCGQPVPQTGRKPTCVSTLGMQAPGEGGRNFVAPNSHIKGKPAPGRWPSQQSSRWFQNYRISDQGVRGRNPFHFIKLDFPGYFYVFGQQEKCL